MPSLLAMSNALVTTLPYLDFHLTEFGPTAPWRSIPAGKTQMSAGISVFQSMDLAVITILSGPLYTTRVQAVDDSMLSINKPISNSPVSDRNLKIFILGSFG
jgi:hypothetical protein